MVTGNIKLIKAQPQIESAFKKSKTIKTKLQLKY